MNPAGYAPDKGEQVVGTPDNFLSAVHRRFGALTWDLATDGANEISGVDGFFTEEQDALTQEWPSYGINWLNPPFRMISKFFEKAILEADRGATTFALVPASIGSKWYRDLVDGKALVIPLGPKRLTFKTHDKPYPKDLMLVIYGFHGITGMQRTWDWSK